LHYACQEANIDLQDKTVAVVGIPGSIAAAAANLLAPHCRKILLVARRESQKARDLAAKLDAELLLDIPTALAHAEIVFSATSSGNCIAQDDLQSGSIVVDVGVPADVLGTNSNRNDVLIISGGLTLIPDGFPRNSPFLRFQHGVIAACFAETILLALEKRAENFSIGRNLSIDRVDEIGAIATKHGFRFDRLYSFGLPLEASQLAKYRKALVRRGSSKRIVTEAEENSHALQAVHSSSTTSGDGLHAANGEARCSPEERLAQPNRVPSPQEVGTRASKRFERHINPVLFAIGGQNGFVKTFTRGLGNHLWDHEGNRYVDFVSGFGAANLGHNHPRIVEEVTRSMQLHSPGFAQSAINPVAALLAEELVAISPNGLEMVFFCNSGTEAVEAALKLARLSTGRAGLLHCERSFHGKSFGSLSITGNPHFQKPFGPLLPDCGHVPYADLAVLERALSTRKYACFIVEPIQAEAGIYVPPREYLPEAQRLCRQHGTLLVVDEVQTGLGRTGTMFAVDSLGVEPDIMTLAKSLGGGLVPIGATLSRRDLWLKAYGSVDRFALHTSTFGGGSLACTAGLATLRVLREERLLERCRLKSERLIGGLQKLAERHQYDPLEEVRGQGLLVGLEFSPLLPPIAAHYRASVATGLLNYVTSDFDALLDTVPTMYAMQTLLNVYGIYSQVARSNPFVLRIQPPLSIEDEQIDQLLAAIDTIAADLADCAAIVESTVSKSTLGLHQADTRSPLQKPVRHKRERLPAD
jgi:3-acetyloctanal aminotransferase